MLLTGRFRHTSLWIWNSPARGPLRVFVRPDRPTLVERMRRLFAEDPGEVEVMLDRRRQDRRAMASSHEPERRRADRRRPRVPRLAGDAIVAVGHAPSSALDYTPPSRTKGEDRMMSVESKQVRDGDEVRRWLEAGQTQLASLLELLHEHDRLRERVEASERENERLRGVTYENEQLRNRLETSERQAEHLRQSLSELRGENERHQKEREDAAERLNHLVNEIAQRLRPGGMARS
jgi:dynactin complex subunit